MKRLIGLTVFLLWSALPAVALIGDPMLDAVARDIRSGETFRLSDKRGDNYLVVFFASQCPPCQQQIEALALEAEGLQRANIEVIALALDPVTSEVERFVDTHNVPFRFAQLSPSSLEFFSNIKIVPFLFLVDRNGVIRYEHTGIIPNTKLLEEIDALLWAIR
ncbi:peroxiredoxin family protein [Chrysiogenes arsenatis]|uniref:peroxiredoxin family protein n=1 Tax=Chrysiogenes arsenatis TaxID=309797 RepID=UPI00041DEE33|nr:TlpA disulfide reductase family protein [Chrysiogenes arsenatis]